MLDINERIDCIFSSVTFHHKKQLKQRSDSPDNKKQWISKWNCHVVWALNWAIWSFEPIFVYERSVACCCYCFHLNIINIWLLNLDNGENHCYNTLSMGQILQGMRLMGSDHLVTSLTRRVCCGPPTCVRGWRTLCGAPRCSSCGTSCRQGY